MIDYPEILAAILPVFLAMVLGFVLRRIRVLTAEADRSLMKLTINFLFPLYILGRTVDNPALSNPANVFMPALAGLTFVLLAMGAGFCLSPIFGVRNPERRRTFSVAVGIQNYGFIAIPVLISVFPENPGAVGVLLAHSVGVEIALWTVGIALLTGQLRSPLKQLINAPLIAVIAGVSLNGVGAGPHIPGVLRTLFDLMGNCAIPLSLLLIGASVHDLTKSARWISSPRMALGACLIRLALIPAIMLLAIAFVPLTPELRQVLVVQAAMPAALFPILLSRHFGGDAPTAVQVVIITTLVSFATTPLVILIGQKLLS